MLLDLPLTSVSRERPLTCENAYLTQADSGLKDNGGEHTPDERWSQPVWTARLPPPRQISTPEHLMDAHDLPM